MHAPDTKHSLLLEPDLASVALPPDIYELVLTVDAFPDCLDHVLDLVGVDRGAPARADALAAVYQD